MNQASSGYTRLMKTLTIWVMALFLFAPITTIITPKTPTQNGGLEIAPTVAQAAGCTILNAVFNPSSTGNDKTNHEANFYIGRQSNDSSIYKDAQEKVVVKIRTKDCVGSKLKLQIYGLSGWPLLKYSEIENNANTRNNSQVDDFIEFSPISPKGDGFSTTTITMYPGEYNCRADGGTDDCQLFLEIYRKAATANDSDALLLDTKNPERINQRGYLGYECTGAYCSTDDKFRLVSIDYNDQDPLDDLWYYTDSKKDSYYIAVGANTAASCKTVVTDLKKDNSDIDPDSCTNNPDYKDISSSSSIVNQGKPVAQAAVGACFQFSVYGGIFDIPNCIAILLKDAIYPVIAWAVALVGQMFDFVFMYTISSEPYKNNFITYAWTFVRDLCNASFIFILLYIAIMTVLNNTAKADYRKLLPRVILVALVINFSLFFGRAIIDIGNASARVLYSSDIVSIKNSDGTPGSISGALIDSFDPQNLIQNGASNFNKSITNGKDGGEVSAISIIIITLMSIFMLFLLCKLFLELAFVFIGRIVGLWMQLILAPIAFIADAVPFIKIPAIAGGGGAWSWFETTFKQSIQAAVFAFFLYLTLLFAKLGIVNVQINGVSSGIAFFLSIIIPFLIIYTLLETAKKQSISMATAIANSTTQALQGVAGTVAKVGLLAGSVAVAPLAARTIGGLAAKASNSGMLKSLSGRAGMGGNFITKGFNNFVADTATKTSGGLANLSKNKFDARDNSLVKGAFRMAGLGDTKTIDATIPGLGKNIITDKLNSGLKSAGETSRLQGLDAMAKAKTDQMNRRLEAMKLTEGNIDKGKVKDDRHEMAVWLKKQREELNIAREAAKTAGTAFDEQAFKTTYEATNKKPTLNYAASATTKDAKVIADVKNKGIEKVFSNRMLKESKSLSVGQQAANLAGFGAQYQATTDKWEKKIGMKEDPTKGAQKKFAKDKNKALEKSKRRRSVLNSDLERIAKQEIDTQKNISKLTTEMNALVSVLSQKNARNKFAPNVDSYKEVLDKKRADPIFSARVAELSNRTKYPADHPAVKQLEKDIRKAAGDAYNKQYEKPIDDAKKARDDAKIQFDIVKNDKTDPNYAKYKIEYETKQKEFAGIESEVSKVKKVIEKTNKKEESLEKEVTKRSGLVSQQRNKAKALSSI